MPRLLMLPTFVLLGCQWSRACPTLMWTRTISPASSLKTALLYDVTLERDDIFCIPETEEEEMVPLMDDFISSICQDIHNHFPKVKRKRLSRNEIQKRCHLQVPDEFKDQYLDILCKNQYDLGLAKNFKLKIHLKTQDPVYRKQLKIPEPHHQFSKQNLDE